jgi:hypothetical protein
MALNWEGLLRGELILVLNVTLGLGLGILLLRFRVPDKVLALFRPFLVRMRISPDIVTALAVSIGSSRAGSAMVAASMKEKRLSRKEALFGTLLQAFPGYLRRWITSFAVATGLAGVAGAVYSLVLLLRSFLRFLFFLFLLRRDECRICDDIEGDKKKVQVRTADLLKVLKRTLPLACTFYAGAYILAPWLQEALSSRFVSFPLLSTQGLTVAVSALAHATAALGAAGGYLASGAISPAQAVLALLVGNLLGTVFRVVRQNMAFWIGLFPADMVRSLLLWHLATLVPLMILSITIAGMFVLLGL